MANINHLNIKGFGLALGITWGFAVFILGIAAWWFGWGTGLVDVLGTLYFGYEATLVGSIIGLGWGFVDGFIGGAILAWLYNIFSG